MSADEGLADVADELYGVAPEEFVAERDASVREIRGRGDRELAAAVAKLPKPTVAGWLLNQLVRRRPDAVEQLVALGDEMRAAQQHMAGDELRALSRQRQSVVTAFVRQVRGLAAELQQPVSDSVAEQVTETLRAAVADPEAARALRSGRLTKGLSYVGLGELDDPPAGDQPGPQPDRERVDRERAEKAVRAAEETRAAATERLAVADTGVEERRSAVDRAEAGLADARERLRAAEEERDQARQQADHASEAVERAERSRR